MAAPVIDGLAQFLSANLGVEVWSGEVPRYDSVGNPISPESTNVSDFPVIKLTLEKPGLKRNYTFEDPYDDEGPVLIQIWATSEAQLVTPVSGTPVGLIDRVEALFAQAHNWDATAVPLGGPSLNPYYVVSMLLQTWWHGQMDPEEYGRGPQGELLFSAEMVYECRVHGAVSSF